MFSLYPCVYTYVVVHIVSYNYSGDLSVFPPYTACVYGDPHIVTLDGFKYGKGEYLLAQVDDVFSFQGRMTQAVNPQGDQVGASVLFAVAMSDGSNVVQFQVGFLNDPDASSHKWNIYRFY